jgi:hypothetical protein
MGTALPTRRRDRDDDFTIYEHSIVLDCHLSAFHFLTSTSGRSFFPDPGKSIKGLKSLDMIGVSITSAFIFSCVSANVMHFFSLRIYIYSAILLYFAYRINGTHQSRVMSHEIYATALTCRECTIDQASPRQGLTIGGML